MARCGNCGGGYFQGLSAGMMSGPMCKCGNRSTNAAPRRPPAQSTSSERCGNCGGGYFEGLSAGMMSGPMCKCGNRSTNADPRRPPAQSTSSGITAGMSVQSSQAQRSYSQQRAQGQPLSTTTDSVPLGLGIAIGLVLGVLLCLGFVFIF